MISGKTGLLCLLGSPVSHSISPAMHNEACRQLGLDHVYLAFDVDEEGLEDAVKGLKAIGAAGWNITMPCKNKMTTLADEISLASQITGACNTIVNDNGKLTAYTTDGIGFMKAVEECGQQLQGKTMTLLGAGGAGTAILAQAALDGVKKIHVFNRKDPFFAMLEHIAQQLNEKTDCEVIVHDIASAEELKEAIEESTILVNSTSVGMSPDTDATPLPDKTLFRPDLFVFDVIYNPQKTRFLQEAEEAGCKTANGMYMLLHQGAASFQLWTGKDMPVEQIRELYF